MITNTSDTVIVINLSEDNFMEIYPIICRDISCGTSDGLNDPVSCAPGLARKKSLQEKQRRKDLHSGLKGPYYHAMEPYCLTVLFFFFFWAGLLFLITYPICDTARLTLYEREVLAPGAGHRGASGLISNQVRRQTGGGTQSGTRWDRRTQTEQERVGGRETRDCGTASYPPVCGLFSRGTPAVLDRHAKSR